MEQQRTIKMKIIMNSVVGPTNSLVFVKKINGNLSISLDSFKKAKTLSKRTIRCQRLKKS